MLVLTRKFDESIVGRHRRDVYARTCSADAAAGDNRHARLEGAAAPTEP